MKKELWFKFSAILAMAILMVFVSACTDDNSGDGDTDGDSEAVNEEDADNEDAEITESDGDIDEDGDIEAEEEPTVIGPKKEERDGYTILWLHGTPYEMGYQHGQLLKDTIKEAMDFVENDIILSSIPALAESMGILELAEDTSYQDILDECQGLIDGAEEERFTMTYCLALNFGDVMLENIPLKSSDEGPGCTEIVAAGPANEDGRLYHARNLDWGSMDISIIHQHPVIFVRQPKDAIPHAFVGFPLNISPYTGMNAAGLSICSNEADPHDETQKDKEGRSHVQMLYMLLKNASTLDEARQFLAGEDHMSSEIIVVADGNNKEAGVFEMTAKHMKERNLEDGIVYAVNHFLDPEMANYDAEQDPDAVIAGEATDSSLMRLWRLQQLVDKDGEDTLYGSLGPEGLISVMRDSVNPITKVAAPYDIEHPDNDAGIGTNGPMHFVLFDPEKLLFWVAAGKLPIPEQPFKCFSLGELLGYPDAIPCDPAQYE